MQINEMLFKKIILQTWYFGVGFTIMSVGLLSYLTGIWIFLFQVPYRDGILLSQNDIPFHRTNWSTKGVEALHEWVAVEGTELYYFSAYKDDGKIIVISIVEKSDKPYNVICRFFSKDGILLHYKTRGVINYIPEDHNKRYTASFVNCKSPHGEKPHAVALISTKYTLPIVYVPIIYVQDQYLKYNFTVCVCPLRLELQTETQFVEMIELNRILGADQFIIYDFKISPNITTILDYYRDKVLLNVTPWHFPPTINVTRNSSTSGIHYFGQLAALNDCIYRSKGVSRFVVNQDMDEFIIPRRHKNWFEMTESLPHNIDYYMFLNTFFRKDWPDINGSFLSKSDITLAKKFGSVTILKQVRETEIFPQGKRSKYIINPKCVKIAGIHDIYELEQSSRCKNYAVSNTIGLLHHYRYIEERGYVPSTKDTRINAFKTKLLQSICKVWTELDISPYTINV